MSPFTDLERHLLSLGVAPLRGDHFVPTSAGVWARLKLPPDARVPEALRWFVARFGGCKFRGGAFYLDAKAGGDVMVGWFLDEEKLVSTCEAYRESLPAEVVLLSNDGGDNHLAVGVGPANSGVVYFHLHDAPLDRNLYVIDESFEHFLGALHRETPT